MCRFESADGHELTQVDILELYKRMMTDFKVCSMELLNTLNGKKLYSSAQGQ
jgi:isocitrate dehydrogenase